MIIERIIRQEPTKFVTPGSTPVVSFGDFTTARLATLSINPSSREFTQGRTLLPIGKKRLIDKQTLGIDLVDPIRKEHAETIWQGCVDYFGVGGNPLNWFTELGKVLGGAGRSYTDGMTCHIDLVQWATSPAWGGQIPEKFRQKFLEQDYEFFKWQVSQPHIEALVVNGRQPYEVLKKTDGFVLREVGTYSYLVKKKTVKSTFFEGRGPSNKKVLGWTGALGPLRVSGAERLRIYTMLGDWLARNL